MKTKDLVVLIIWLVLIIAVCGEATLPPSVNNDNIPHLDKMVHFLVFGLIAYLCAWLLHRFNLATDKPRVVGILFFIAVLGIIAEWIQSHIPGRDASLQDMYANFIGAGVFLLVWKQQQLARKVV